MANRSCSKPWKWLNGAYLLAAITGIIISINFLPLGLQTTCHHIFNTLRLSQNGRHFPDAIFKWIFLNENVFISLDISLKFVPRFRINNIPPLVQIMAWRRLGDKPLSEPMMVRLLTHICATRPQWVKWVEVVPAIYIYIYICIYIGDRPIVLECNQPCQNRFNSLPWYITPLYISRQQSYYKIKGTIFCIISSNTLYLRPYVSTTLLKVQKVLTKMRSFESCF